MNMMQNSHEDYRELRIPMEQILAELDRLKLGTVAVHVDNAIRRLEMIVAGGSKTLGGIKAK